MKKIYALIMIVVSVTISFAQNDWDQIPVPAKAGENMIWELQEAPSDNFNYVFEETDQKVDFGPENKWYNFYHANWDGPGTTYWKYNHVSVDGSDLSIRMSRWSTENEELPRTGSPNKLGLADKGVNSACITGYNRVIYPVFVEASISIPNITMATAVWLLSPDDTQEIDILEAYGGRGQGNSFFAQLLHLSHHSFIRQPFTDYQPRDRNSWWGRQGVTSWGEYSWNGGDRRYVQIGVNWIDPFHWEYYVDGELVRVLYKNAFATKVNGTWRYTYPTMTDGVLDQGSDGWQKVVSHSNGGAIYSFEALKAASDASDVSVIDPYEFQDGNGFTKELDIIINAESQDWQALDGRTPDDDDLKDSTRNIMLVDWIRVYKPVPGQIWVSDVNVTPEILSTGISQKRQIRAEVLPVEAGDKSLKWSSSDESVATVDENGWVTGLKAGTATITATSSFGEDNSDIKASATLTVVENQVEVPVTAIVTDIPPTRLAVSSATTIEISIEPEDATDKTITWSSSDENLATVTQEGLVTAVADGNVIITATAESGVKKDVPLEIYTSPIIWDDPIAVRSKIYKAGETMTLNCTFDAGDETVDSEGIKFWFREILPDFAGVVQSSEIIAFDKSAVGKSKGSATVEISLDGVKPTADLDEGNFYFLWITFNGTQYQADGLSPITIEAVKATGIDIDANAGKVELGQTLGLSATVMPANSSQAVVWSSSNENIATVDSEGLVTGLSIGSTIITAKSVDGDFEAMTTVNVEPVTVTGVTVSSSTTSIITNETLSVTAVVAPEQVSQEVTWSSSDESIATVNSEGLVTALSQGEVTITATSKVDESQKSSLIITVNTITNAYTVEKLLKVYPNPAKKFIRVDARVGIDHITISDLIGNIVWSEKVNGYSQTIGIGQLAEGIYILNIKTTDNDQLVTKFMVE